VEAVGTAFSVRTRDSGADVLVTEGVVSTWVEGAEGHKVRIAAGERGFIAQDDAIERRTSTEGELERALAWRSGKIDLAGEPLREAVAEFNRYNDIQIVIADPAVAGMQFYGIFRTNDPEGFAKAVNQTLNVRVVADGQHITIGAPPP